MTLTPRDKRMLQILAVVAGLALVYFLFTTVLAGDGEDVAAPTGPTGGQVEPPASPTETPSPTPRETLPPVDLAGARDPFSIPPGLATETPGGSVSPTTPPPGGTTTTPPPTGTTPPPTGTTPPPTGTTTPPPPPPPTDSTTIGGHQVTIESISNERGRVRVRVDGRLWTVEEGAIFEETYRLVSIDGPCARFLFGDESFTLCLK